MGNLHLLRRYMQVDQFVLIGFFQQYWIQIPLISARDQADCLMEGGQTDEEREPQDDTWKWSVYRIESALPGLWYLPVCSLVFLHVNVFIITKIFKNLHYKSCLQFCSYDKESNL